MNVITVATGCRLHFGLLCGKEGTPWRFGGIGMMVNSPGWNLRVAVCSDQDQPSTCVAETEGGGLQAEERVSQVLTACGRIWPKLAATDIRIRSEIPQHCGLGSGTQLTIAVASAIHFLMEQSRQTSSTQLARQLGRSRRSAIGTVGFDRGGFLFDHGTGANSQTEHSYDRVLFPDKWRMVLITPQTEAGLSGSQEEAYFDKPRFMAADVVEQQVSLIRNDILPSLLQQDLPAFRTALETYGRIIGEYFAPEQGGVFSSQQVQKLADWLKTKDVTGIVQSSWGPTVCIPAESDEAALDLQQLISQAPDADQFSVRIASGMNSGATISSPAPETFDHVFRG